MSELTKRILFGLPAAALFLWLVWLGGTVFQIFTALIALASLFEIIALFKKLKYPAVAMISVLIGVFIWTVQWQPVWLTMGISLLIVLITVWAVAGRRDVKGNRWLATLFCGLYVPLGFLLFYEIRLIGPDETGLWLIFTLILMIWGNDMFAYFGGRSLGKRPLAPNISPNKTWEGFWSGFAGALAGFLIIYFIADPYPITVGAALPMVVLVSIFGPAGDLAESRLKRLAGVKDSSSALPGHGGFLDRFDALILCSPILFIYLIWVV